jgi:hypothetical protein
MIIQASTRYGVFITTYETVAQSSGAKCEDEAHYTTV